MFVFVIVLGVGVGTYIDSPFVSHDEPVLDIGPDAYAWDGTPPRIPITVRDPGGRERWAVQIYRSKAGNPCLRVGRLHRNDRGITDFGRVDPDGSFHRLDIEDSGSPTDLSNSAYALMVNHYILTGTAAIFGIVTSKVKTVTLHLGPEIKELTVSDGAYLAVQQETDLRGAEVRFAYRDGTSKIEKLRWHAPRSHTPPSGLPAD